MTEDIPRLIKVELIVEPSINATIGVGTTGVDIAMVSATGPCCMDLIIDFLTKDRVPDDEKEANRVCRVALQHWLSANRKLYQRSFRGPYLLCLHPEKVNELLAELHDGICGRHVGGH